MALGATWQQILAWVIGAVLLVAAWLLMEGAGDVADDLADPSRGDVKWSSVRPRVIIATLLIVAVGLGVALLAGWLLDSAT